MKCIFCNEKIIEDIEYEWVHINKHGMKYLICNLIGQKTAGVTRATAGSSISLDEFKKLLDGKTIVRQYFRPALLRVLKKEERIAFDENAYGESREFVD